MLFGALLIVFPAIFCATAAISLELFLPKISALLALAGNNEIDNINKQVWASPGTRYQANIYSKATDARGGWGAFIFHQIGSKHKCYKDLKKIKQHI